MPLDDGLLGATPRIDNSDTLSGVPSVCLTEEQMVDAKSIAVARLVSYQMMNGDLEDNQFIDDVGDNGPENIYTTGVEGEVAFSAKTGEDVDRRFTKSGDNNYDFKIGDTLIETKTTTKVRPKLLVRNDRVRAGKYDKVDVFVLVYKHEDSKYYFPGYATRQEVMDTEPTQEPSTIVNRVIPWTDLHRQPLSQVTQG